MKVPLQQVEQVVHQHQCKTSSDAIDDVFPRNIEHRWLSLGPARNGIKEKDNCLVWNANAEQNTSSSKRTRIAKAGIITESADEDNETY